MVKRLGRFIGLLHVMIFFISAGYAQTNVECSDKIDTARNKFASKEYRMVIDLLKPCLLNNQLGEIVLRIEAFELVGQSYLQISDKIKAKEAITEIHELWPNYKPDRPFGKSLEPAFHYLVIEVFDEIEESKKPGWFKRNWKYIAGGCGSALLGVITCHLVDDKSKSDEDLPFPPEFPK